MAHDDLSGLKIDKQALQRKPRGRKRWLWWGLVALIAIVVAVLAGRGVLSPSVSVEVATVSQVYPSQTFTLLNASGYVVAQRKAALAAKATGRLEWLGVEEGSRVRQGEVVARLESRDVAAAKQQAAAAVVSARATTEQARAELTEATRNFRRMKELLGQGIVAQADYDSAEARLERARGAVGAAEANIGVAEAAQAGAEVNLDYTLIRAPFDAVVLTKSADVGDIVTPLGAAANAKAAVVTIADLASLQVEADVSEANLGKVKPGQPCEIQLDALPDGRFRGAVHAIVPTADRSKASVMVKVRFEEKDARVLPEMSAKVAFLERQATAAEQRPRTAVNPAAVARRDGRDVLFVIRGDTVTETPVTLGSKIGDLVEVTAGVKAGDKVATKPIDKLRQGTKVTIPGK
ncbi:MAG TPA: efflux RND transporter periplasmic adaptor subunit [Geobacteraceae bacterium]